MVASVGIYEITGTAANPTYTQLTSSRYSLSDNIAPGLNNPVPIPTTGFNYSFWKHHVLNFTGTFTQINNIRWYTDGAIGWNLGTSGNLYIGKRASGDAGAPVSTGYLNASGSTTTCVLLLSGHTYYQQGNAISGTWVTAQTYISGALLTVDSTNYATSGYSKILVTQVAVATNATQGTQTAETVTFLYDEI